MGRLTPEQQEKIRINKKKRKIVDALHRLGSGIGSPAQFFSCEALEESEDYLEMLVAEGAVEGGVREGRKVYRLKRNMEASHG